MVLTGETVSKIASMALTGETVRGVMVFTGARDSWLGFEAPLSTTTPVASDIVRDPFSNNPQLKK